MSRMAIWRSRSRRSQFFLVLFVSCLASLAGCNSDNNKKSKNPVPAISSLSPSSVTAGGSAFALTVNGSGFVDDSTVQWNGSARATTYVSASMLTAGIAVADVASVGTAQVTVVNPTPGGGTSAAVSFAITAGAPEIASLSPASIVAGSGAFDLTVSGSGFAQGATVQWNGAARTTVFVSSSAVKASITAADVATAGTAQVSVANPPPGGGTSAPLTFAIQNPAPVLGMLNPTTVAAGGPAFNLVVSGAGFQQGATVQWGGTNRTTTVISATEVVAAINASDVANAGFVDVVARNPEPTVGPSNTLQFAITSAPTQPPSGFPVRISEAPDGSAPNGPSVNGGMDLTGRYVIFASKASNLIPGDTNDAWDVFVRDTCTDVWDQPIADCQPTTTRISVAPDGSQADGDSGSTVASPEHGLAVSFDGRYVAYVSSATNLVANDTNGVDDVFVTSTCLGSGSACVPQTVRASLRSDGSQSDWPASGPAIGVDGGHVVFVSEDPSIVTGDANGAVDVYLRDLCPASESGCTPGTRRISVGLGGSDANGASGAPVFTGRYVVFTSAATNLVAGDTNNVVDVFLRDTCIGGPAGCRPTTERISVGNGDVQANGASSEPCVGLPSSGMDGFDYHGRFVVFVSAASNLVAGDTNAVSDVFMRDTCRGRTDCVPSTQRISLTSTGQQIGGQPSLQPEHMRWDGEEVLFVTAADGVVPEDTNGLRDVFMVHVCHDSTGCVQTVRIVSKGEGGVLGNGASYAPRGNYELLGGPDFATFVSEATNLVADDPGTPNYASVFKTAARY